MVRVMLAQNMDIGDIMATNKAFCSYQEIIDLHTESDRVTAIGIHTPNNDTPQKMFGGFFDQFKKYKYLGCSITLVPVARLPVDPLQVSYDAGEPTIDPRDVVNPIMFHGCHGNDIGAILNQLYTIGTLGSNDMIDVFSSDSTDMAQWFNGDSLLPDDSFTLLENLYYKALVDNTWKKAHPQKGFKKSGLRPLIYKVATNYQITGYSPASLLTEGPYGRPQAAEGMEGYLEVPNVPGDVKLFTNRLTGLGWLDTRQVIGPKLDPMQPEDPSYEGIQETLSELLNQTTIMTKLPKIFMGVILLPPAYKTEQYFRMIINHSFEFAGFRGLSFKNDDLNNMPPSYFNMNDDPTPVPPGPDPPDPPVPSTYSANLHVVTRLQGQAFAFDEVDVTINGVTKSLVGESIADFVWTGLEDGTYQITASVPDGFTLYSITPSTITINGSDVTLDVTLMYELVQSRDVITLSDVEGDDYKQFSINDSIPANVNVRISYNYTGSPVSAASVLDGVIYLHYRTTFFNLTTMKYGTISGGVFTVSGDIDTVTGLDQSNVDFVTLLRTGDYDVEVE